MIRRCTNQDNEVVMDYLNRDRVINLFIVGDIENFGYDSDFQDVFMDVDDDGIHAIYLNYRGNIVLCSYEKKIDNDFVRKMINDYDVKNINAISEVMDLVDLTGFTREDTYFAKMTKKNEVINVDEVKLLSLDDLDNFNFVYKEVFDTEVSYDSFKNELDSKSGRRYGIFVDDKIVSVASSTAECEGLAMVVGVGTLKDYRGNSYASKCISKLSNELLDEGKTPCLFYNNPSAGRIYKALGYEDIGEWSLARKNKQ